MKPSTTSSTAPTAQVLIWDAPVRVFHWLLVLCFAGAWVSAESERWRLLHVTLGYTMAGLVAFRLVWGLVGTRHARFTDFVRGPRAVLQHLRAMARLEPEAHAGHNPVGALAIVALLALTLVIAVTGWAAINEVGGEWLAQLHDGTASLMMAVAGVHVAGVLLGIWLQHENLVRSMITGRKRAAPGEAIRRPWRGLAALLLAAVLGYWALEWTHAPPAAAAVGADAGHDGTVKPRD